MERILGHGVDLLVGTPIIDLCHPRDRSALVASLREVRSGRMGAVTFRTRHRDGRWIWLESRLHAVVDDFGRVVELQSVSRDVTERQQARAELERPGAHRPADRAGEPRPAVQPPAGRRWPACGGPAAASR